MTSAAPAIAAPSLREQKKTRTRAALHEAAAALVAASSLGEVTIEEICAVAEVSPRTFFNYFPSKSAAVLGLPDRQIPEEASARFLAARGNVVHDLCHLVASMLEAAGRPDRAAMRELMHRHPELQPELHGWLTSVKRGVLELAEQRTDADSARSAMALVMAAVADATQHDDRPGATGERLWQRVLAMAALVS